MMTRIRDYKGREEEEERKLKREEEGGDRFGRGAKMLYVIACDRARTDDLGINSPSL
jgi:hypothetical protein